MCERNESCSNGWLSGARVGRMLRRLYGIGSMPQRWTLLLPTCGTRDCVVASANKMPWRDAVIGTIRSWLWEKPVEGGGNQGQSSLSSNLVSTTLTTAVCESGETLEGSYTDYVEPLVLGNCPLQRPIGLLPEGLLRGSQTAPSFPLLTATARPLALVS